MHFQLSTLWSATSLPGKIVLVVLLLMAVFVVALAFERFFIIGRDKKRGQSLLEATQSYFEQIAPDWKTLLDVIGKAPYSTIQQIMLALIREHVQLLSDVQDPVVRLEEVEELERVLERAIVRESHYIKKGMAGLATVASSAPFVGLLGTVVGIIHVFSMMKLTGSPNLSMIAGGIGEALITTAIGLVVAIPAGAFYNLFGSASDKNIGDLRDIGGEVLLNLARMKRASHIEKSEKVVK